MASRDSKLRAASGNPAPTPNDSIVAPTKPRSLPCAARMDRLDRAGTKEGLTQADQSFVRVDVDPD